MRTYIIAFKNFFKFSGRTERKAFWLFSLFNFMIFIVVFTMDAFLRELIFPQTGINTDVSYLVIAYLIIVFFPSLTITIRRLHDIGQSGWILLLAFLVIPIIMVFNLVEFENGLGDGTLIVGAIILFFCANLIYLLCKDSEPGENKYGPNPKQAKLNKEGI